jgi:hypothetical protein
VRHSGALRLELTVPEHVNVVMAELTADLREGLLALAVGTGLQVMTALMEEDVTALAGRKGKHHPDRVAVRHGHEAGSVTLGGRRVPVQRPWVRAADGSGELPVAAYELFNGTELLGRLAMEKMLAGLSTHRYGRVGLGCSSSVVEVFCNLGGTCLPRRGRRAWRPPRPSGIAGYRGGRLLQRTTSTSATISTVAMISSHPPGES